MFRATVRPLGWASRREEELELRLHGYTIGRALRRKGGRMLRVMFERAANGEREQWLLLWRKGGIVAPPVAVDPPPPEPGKAEPGETPPGMRTCQYGRRPTDDQVREMRRARADGMSMLDIALEHDMLQRTVENAVRGRTFKHVTDVKPVVRGYNRSISDDMVRDMRRDRLAGKTMKEIAEKHGTSMRSTERAVRGASYAHVTDPPGVVRHMIRAQPLMPKGELLRRDSDVRRRLFTDEQVREMRAEAEAGATYVTLAEKYGVSKSGARNIVMRLSYKDVV